MKQINIIFTILLPLFSFSQISYERTAPSGVDAYEFLTTESAEYYIDTDKDALQINFYNLDFSFSHSINIPQSDSVKNMGIADIYTYYTAEKLFDNDNYTETVVAVIYYDEDWEANGGNMHPSEHHLLDDDGTSLFSSDKSISIYNTSEGAKMNVRNSDNEVEIYGLPGELPCGPCGVINGMKSPNLTGSIPPTPFPNPSSGRTTVKYSLPANTKEGELNIYNIHGSLLNTYKITNRFSQLELNLNHLKNGTYFYKVNANNQKGESQKLIIAR